MTPPVEMVSPPSEGSTCASGHDSGCGLKNAIMQHFCSLAGTHTTHHVVPVCWNAGEWNARTWASGGMEESVKKLFNDLGLDSSSLNNCLSVVPGQRTNGFWLPVWKFRCDRGAKNGRPALSCVTRVQHSSRRLYRVLLRCVLRSPSLPPDVQCDGGRQGNHGDRLRFPQGGPRCHPGR